MVALHQVLSDMSWTDQKYLLKLANFPDDVDAIAYSSKGVTWLEENIFGKNLKNTWDTLLSPLDRLAIAESIYNTDGYIMPDHIHSKYGQTLILKKNDLPVQDRRNPAKTPRIKLFLYKRYPIPEDVVKELKVFVPKPKPSVLAVQSNPSDHNPHIEGERGALQIFTAQKQVLCDLISIMTLIRQENLAIGVSEVPTVALTQKISTMLSELDYFVDIIAKQTTKNKSMRAFAWVIILKGSKLIDTSNERVSLTKSGEELLIAELATTPSAKTIKKIFESFWRNTRFDEIMRIDTLVNTKKGRRWDSTAFSSASIRRRTVLETLCTCPIDAWIRTKDFLTHLRCERPRFTALDRVGDLHLGENKVAVAHMTDHWFPLEGTYVKCLLMEYLATLGLIEVNYSLPVFCDNEHNIYKCQFISSYDGLFEFKITPLGAYCFGMIEEEPPVDVVPHKLFHVTPNLEVSVVADHMLKSDIVMMDSCMDKINRKTWKLNTAKMLSMEDKKDGFLPTFKTFLQERALSEMPKTVEHFFDDMERRTTQVTCEETAKVYICKAHDLARLIATDPRTQPFCIDAGENKLVVPVKTEQAFKAGLRNVGYLIPQEKKAAS